MTFEMEGGSGSRISKHIMKRCIRSVKIVENGKGVRESNYFVDITYGSSLRERDKERGREKKGRTSIRVPGIVSDERKKQRTLLGFPACMHASR